MPADIEACATAAVHAAFLVHQALGPGLLENAYRECVLLELRSRNLVVERERCLPLRYRDCVISTAYRCDLLVNDCLLIELKALEELRPVHRVQVATYLRLLNLPLGLLINFNVPLIREGIHRVLNLAMREPLSFSTSAAPDQNRQQAG